MKVSTLKRLFDIVFSFLGLILSSWLWALIWLSIILDDGVPVLITQKRVGKDGKIFKSFKFRSMKKYTLQEKINHQAQANDPRITGIGRLLRRTALDELPQLINILRGEMSFVGPRPLLLHEVEVSSQGENYDIRNVAGYKERTAVRPGLTGVAQIYAPRDLPREKKFKYDLFYIKKSNFCLDIKLLLFSFLISFNAAWERKGRKLRFLNKKTR